MAASCRRSWPSAYSRGWTTSTSTKSTALVASAPAVIGRIARTAGTLDGARACFAAPREQRQAGRGERAERRDRAAGGGRREHQLEERDGVAGALLQRAERAVAVVGRDDDAL